MKNNRRDFIKKGTAMAALSITGIGSSGFGLEPANNYQKKEGVEKKKVAGSKIKIALQASPEPDENEIRFIQQMGLGHVVLWTDASKASEEYYASRKKLYGDAGINVYGFGNSSVHNQESIVLNLPGRDAKIEEYKNHIRNLGKAGIGYTTYAHMGNGIWSTAREATRGGAMARGFDLSKATMGAWGGKRFSMPLSHGRKYTEDEMWANYEYFIKQVVPVAEEAHVHIGIHPDDPPVPELAGVPRCIFGNFEGYRRAMEIANSPNVGLCLCVGCWLEGGPLMGKNVLETIDYFGKRKKSSRCISGMSINLFRTSQRPSLMMVMPICIK